MPEEFAPDTEGKKPSMPTADVEVLHLLFQSDIWGHPTSIINCDGTVFGRTFSSRNLLSAPPAFVFKDVQELFLLEFLKSSFLSLKGRCNPNH
ncbi:hypothetical protein CDAR_246191 [Caerostris darwini]|uniref:Uncharacterized protein n=1 Tax=Caerostris darwini TaxID=1538125 RepID=A0AAV4W7T8_9ARAC|nr:hypothetical protein CDAR_246191 [Caerostris darwini]